MTNVEAELEQLRNVVRYQLKYGGLDVAQLRRMLVHEERVQLILKGLDGVDKMT